MLSASRGLKINFPTEGAGRPLNPGERCGSKRETPEPDRSAQTRLRVETRETVITKIASPSGLNVL
eukprot:1046312-Prymnesium_polylepis.1